MMLSTRPTTTRRKCLRSSAPVLGNQSNLANTYRRLGRFEEALRLREVVYSGTLNLHGAETESTMIEANNYANTLIDLERFEEAKSLLRKTMPVARRVLGESHEITLRMRSVYAAALCNDTGATLDDVREAMNTLEEIEPIARRVLGGAHPDTLNVEKCLRIAREALRARMTLSGSA